MGTESAKVCLCLWLKVCLMYAACKGCERMCMVFESSFHFVSFCVTETGINVDILLGAFVFIRVPFGMPRLYL